MSTLYTIKPLVWKELIGDYWESEIDLVRYYVKKLEDGTFELGIGKYDIWGYSFHESSDAAKSAAQEDWEKRLSVFLFKSGSGSVNDVHD